MNEVAKMHDSDTSDAHYEAGQELEEQEEYDAAMAEYRKALELCPTDSIVCHTLGSLLKDLERFEEAEDLYRETETAIRRALEEKADDADLHYDLAGVLAEQGEHRAALEEYARSLDLDPNDTDKYYGLGRELRDLRRYDESAAALRKAIEIDPEDADLYKGLADSLRYTTAQQEVVDACKEAIRLDPEDPETYITLGNALADLEQWPEAVAAYNETLKRDPEYAYAHGFLGSALWKSGQKDDGLAEYKKAVELEPDDRDLLIFLIHAYAELDQFDDVISAARAFLDTTPDDGEVHAAIAEALRQKGDSTNAAKEFAAAIELDSMNKGILVRAGDFFMEADSTDSAIETYRMLADVDNENPAAWYGLGCALKKGSEKASSQQKTGFWGKLVGSSNERLAEEAREMLGRAARSADAKIAPLAKQALEEMR